MDVKGVLVYSGAIDELEDQKQDIEIFLQIAQAFKEKFDYHQLLEKDPPEEDRYLKYIPVYDPKRAFRKYIKKQKTADLGWLPVKEGVDYPNSCFALQMEDGGWEYFDTKFKIEDCPGKLILIQSDKFDIEEIICGKLTLTQREIKENLLKTTINDLCIEKYGSDTEKIILEGISEGDFEIIGVKWEIGS